MAVERLKRGEKILLVAQLVQLVTSLGSINSQSSLRLVAPAWGISGGRAGGELQKPVFRYDTLHFPLL